MTATETTKRLEELSKLIPTKIEDREAIQKSIGAVQITERMREKIEEYQEKYPMLYTIDAKHVQGPESVGIITNEIERIQEKIKEDADFYIICEMAKLYMEGIRPTYEEHLNKPEPIYSAMIPLNPKTKKNSQKIIISPKTKRPIIVQSDNFRQYEREAGWFLKTPAQPIDYPVNVRVLFFRDSARRVDLTNLLEAIDDLLVSSRILKDDDFKIIAGHDGSRVYIDREKPRTEIYIEHISKYNKQKEADS